MKILKLKLIRKIVRVWNIFLCAFLLLGSVFFWNSLSKIQIAWSFFVIGFFWTDLLYSFQSKLDKKIIDQQKIMLDTYAEVYDQLWNHYIKKRTKKK